MDGSKARWGVKYLKVFVYFIRQLVQGKRRIRVLQNIKEDEVQRDIPVRETLCLPRLVQRIVTGDPAVDGDEQAGRLYAGA